MEEEEEEEQGNFIPFAAAFAVLYYDYYSCPHNAILHQEGACTLTPAVQDVKDDCRVVVEQTGKP